MKGFKRFACFLILFAIIYGIGNALNFHVGNIIAGLGFGIAYFGGEGNVEK